VLEWKIENFILVQGGYRSLGRLALFLSAVRLARRKASASAPPDGLILARRWDARANVGASGRTSDAAAITTDLVLEAQRQRDLLPPLVHVQDLYPHDVKSSRLKSASARD
jgi:hypothetical protein